jgi:hypothetical protein
MSPSITVVSRLKTDTISAVLSNLNMLPGQFSNVIVPRVQTTLKTYYNIIQYNKR